MAITPFNPHANWDPTGLALVPADFDLDKPLAVCPQLCALHSAEIFAGGRFQPAKQAEVKGPQCLRLLFAVGDGIREVKFASMVTYFGRIELPAPLPNGSKKGGSALKSAEAA